jgi:hypothetical protein
MKISWNFFQGIFFLKFKTIRFFAKLHWIRKQYFCLVNLYSKVLKLCKLLSVK